MQVNCNVPLDDFLSLFCGIYDKWIILVQHSKLSWKEKKKKKRGVVKTLAVPSFPSVHVTFSISQRLQRPILPLELKSHIPPMNSGASGPFFTTSTGLVDSVDSRLLRYRHIALHHHNTANPLDIQKN